MTLIIVDGYRRFEFAWVDVIEQRELERLQPHLTRVVA